ncbi:MAG: hypothetical protein ABI725_01175 [Chloroflexota bacterium]
MTKQLYFYEISPGDMDHMPAYSFHKGVVEAEPAEMDALIAEINGRHIYLVEVTPIDEAKIGWEKFRAEVGSGIDVLHREAEGTPLCEEDRELIRAYYQDSEPNRVDEAVEEAYARDSSSDGGDDY